MFNKAKKIKEETMKAQDAAKQAADEMNDAMQELGDDVLDAISGAGDSFASHPRVSTKGISGSVRSRG